MPKFSKTILPAGEYVVTRADGKRIVKEFTPEYLKMVADNSNKMIASGLNIPAPFKHLKNAVPSFDKITETVNTDSYDNAGYWEKLEIQQIDGIPTLVGVIDSPGADDNLDTPAGKLAHRIKEVSACIKDEWEDGKGNKWGPSMLHGAPVHHPVVPGQKGFSILDDSYALSISGMLDQMETGSLSELAAALKESVGVYLPTDISREDLIKVLLVSLKQHKLTAEMNIDDREIVNTSPVFMSLPEGTKMKFTKDQAEEMVSLGAINPKTQKPFELTDFEITDSKAEPDKSLMLSLEKMGNYSKAVTNQLNEERKASLSSRINNLVKTGRVGKEYAEQKLMPQVNSYELSLGEGGKFVETTIESLVASLESLPATGNSPEVNLSNGLPNGYSVHEGDQGAPDAPLKAEDAEAIKKDMLSRM